MQRRAKVFMNNRSQAVRLPKEFQFNTGEVFIRKEGEDVILSPRPTDWGRISRAVRSRPTHSWSRSRIYPCRSESPDGALHAGH
jgi:virulence-associated protein VagC